MAATTWLTSRVRRRLQFAVYITAMVLVVAFAVIGVLAVLAGDAFSLADRLAMLNDVLAGSAVVLALVGAAIALQAHAATTGSPRITVQIVLGSGQPNQPELLSDRLPDGRLRVQGVAGQSMLHVRLHNSAGFDATNVRILITLTDAQFAGSPTGRTDGWRVVDVAPDGATSLDWVGDCWIYAKSTLGLPPVDLPQITQTFAGGLAKLQVRVFADSYQESKPPLRLVFTDVGLSESPGAPPSPPLPARPWL